MKQRLYEIDILRFFASVSVVFFHFSVVFFNEYHYYLVDSPFANHIFQYGNLGVQLFFLISGFVILMSAQGTTPKDYMIARFIRLYPAFVPLCILTYFIGIKFAHNYTVSIHDFLLNLTLVGTFFSKKYVNGAYWTLKVEIFFYCYVYALIYLKKLNSIRTFLNAWLLLSAVTFFGIRYFNFAHVFNIFRFVFITEYSFYFIAGCYFYLMRFEPKRSDSLMPLLCLMLALVVINPGNQERTVDWAVITALFGIFYLIHFIRPKLSRFGNLYYHLGEIIYPLYLSHSVLGVTIVAALYGRYNSWAILIFTVLLLIAFSWLVNRLIEVPIRNYLKRKLLKNASKHPIPGKNHLEEGHSEIIPLEISH